MNVDECYSELGLQPDCSDTEVKAAWRRLAAQWHPDRNGSPQALRKIQRINRALEEIRRARDTGDGAAAARTLEHTVQVSVEEALAGCTREVLGTLEEDCADCAGSGLAAQASRCEECEGAGSVKQQPMWFSWVAPSMRCRACDGQGAIRGNCASCEGSGQAPARRYRARVEIPPGSRTGTLLEVPAQLRGGAAITLRVRVELEPHEFFRVEDDGTVKLDLPVDGFAWMAQRWIEVPTPDGVQQMRLRRDYLVYRIKGRGFPAEDGTRADCIVSVLPLFPEELSKAQESLVERLVASNTGAGSSAAGRQAREWQRKLRQWQGRQA